ncbi:hypothetical protein J6590_000626 [Homalodisca vitripennis]|nr:hypothetical protein J6590_000626 [Homalodisca vitripennis]
MPGDRCVVAGCRNKRAETRNSTEDRVVYHRFPTDEGMYKQWIQRCRRSDKINYRYASVCSDHFTDEDYKRDLKAELLKITPKRLLKPGAVPSLNLMAPIEENPLQAIHNDRKIQRRENKKLVNERLNVDPSICRGENVAQDKTGITLRVATTTDPVKHEYEKLEDNLASIQHGDVVNVRDRVIGEEAVTIETGLDGRIPELCAQWQTAQMTSLGHSAPLQVPMAERSKTLDFKLEIAQVRLLSVTVALFTIDLVLYRLSPLFCLIRPSNRPVAHEDGQNEA